MATDPFAVFGRFDTTGPGGGVDHGRFGAVNPLLFPHDYAYPSPADGDDTYDSPQEQADRLGAVLSSRYAPRSAGAAAQRAFVDRLDAISDTAFLQVLGDSTGDATDEWVYLLASKFAIAYPARSVQYRLWRESTLDYGTPTQVQLGAAGRGYLSSTTGGATTADSARKSLTSCDATVRVWCRPSDLANSGDQVLCGHGGGSTSPNLGWYLYLSNNALKLALSATGSAWHTFATIANAAAVNAIATNGTDVGLGVAITRNSGGNVSYQAIYSADGITWSNFGTPYTGASSIASIYDTNGSIDVGARGTSTESFSGRIYWAEAYKGLTPSTDTLAWRFDASLWSTGTSFVDGDGHTWTLTGSASFTQGAPVLLVMNGSKGGGEIAWATTNIAALMTAPANLTLSSFGHNQDKTLAEMKTFLDLLVTTQAGTGVVAVRQNPTGSAATTKVRQDRQMARLSELIAREGYSTIDAYAAFIADGRGDSLVLSSSDVHPNSTGSTIWANTAGASFGFAST